MVTMLSRPGPVYKHTYLKNEVSYNIFFCDFRYCQIRLVHIILELYVYITPYNHTIIVFFISFSFNPSTVTNFTEHPVGDCADVGRSSMYDIAECKEAASGLGLTYQQIIYTTGAPKGCSSNWFKKVYWNSHENGSANVRFFAICKPFGKYCPRYCI